MRRLTMRIALIFCALIATMAAHGADPSARLVQFSDFPQIDVKRLLAGDILSQRGALMNFPNGISAQFCYVVPTAPAETAKRIQTWDPTRCKALKVYEFHPLRSPSDLNEFTGLRLDPRQRPVKWLVDKTLESTAVKSELNLTQIEAQELANCTRKGHSPATVSSCWANLLQGRSANFQRKGLVSTLPYEFEEESISPSSQIRTMLQEQARITREFTPLLRGAGLINSGTASSPLTPAYSWSFFEADHHATLSLGAVYKLAADDYFQLLAVDYYVSGTYYAAATLYEILPFRIGDKTGSLVWRGDFFAAPTLRFTKGMERIAYGAIMIQEIKKEIRCFQDGI